MAIPVNIDDLINHRVVESTRIEYKSDFNPAPIIRSICAFANDIDNWGGGYLVIGVRDEEGKPKELIGVSAEKIDAYLKDMLNKCKRIQPEYMPITEVAAYIEKKLEF